MDTKKIDMIKVRQIAIKSLVYAFLVMFSVFVLFPFYWMLLMSLKDLEQINNEIPPSLILGFKEMHFWENYTAAWTATTYWRYMVNTVTVAFISTVGTLVTTILASFAFARLNFKGKDLIFMILLSTMMIPGEMFVITNYQTVSSLGWYQIDGQTWGQALLALTMPFMTSIFYIFFLRQSFKQIPDELYLAAKVDGTKDWKYLWKIMIPIAKPTIITITILNAMGTWSAYVWPNLVTTMDKYRLVTNGLRNAYVTINGSPAHNLVMAGAVIVTTPLLIVFIFARKYIMRGVSRSGIKG